MSRTVLLVDDDASVREALAQTLELADIDVVPAGSFVAAKDRITERFDGIILSDMRMPGRDGFHLLAYAHEQDPDLPVILLTGEGDIPMAVRAKARVSEKKRMAITDIAEMDMNAPRVVA